MNIGFHGRNNLELALINTLNAIEYGIELVDATITGMGRGAGNLSTHLLLTVLHLKGKLKTDFNALSRVVDPFENIESHYGWWTNITACEWLELEQWAKTKNYNIRRVI